MQFIDEVEIKDKKVLMRVDYNVSLNSDGSILNDERIRQSLLTIQHLLQHNNTLILMSHLGRPEGRDGHYSLRVVARALEGLLQEYKVVVIDDLSQVGTIDIHAEKTIYMLENLRFFPGEKTNDPEFAKRLASLADVYVNDAFAVCHRSHASVVGLPQLLPAYGGLLLKKEITMLTKCINEPQKPLVAILSGVKINTKINLIGKLMEIADYVLLAGGLANNFLLAQGKQIGKSIAQPDQLEQTRHLMQVAQEKGTNLLIPPDAVIQTHGSRSVDNLGPDDQIFDIGPKTQAIYGAIIDKAKTIVWNGPVGKFEDLPYRRGTDFIYYAITQNPNAISILGGGDTIAAIANNGDLDKITHLSTGGGAMLAFIEKEGKLPGIEALG
jgi:phosphoglycerate kinase